MTRIHGLQEILKTVPPLTLTTLLYSFVCATRVHNMDFPASCKVVLAGSVVQNLLTEVSEGLSKLARAPLLVGFLANTDPAARMYADWTERTCKEK